MIFHSLTFAFFHSKIIIFTAVKNHCILHGRGFIMLMFERTVLGFGKGD